MADRIEWPMDDVVQMRGRREKQGVTNGGLLLSGQRVLWHYVSRTLYCKLPANG